MGTWSFLNIKKLEAVVKAQYDMMNDNTDTKDDCLSIWGIKLQVILWNSVGIMKKGESREKKSVFAHLTLFLLWMKRSKTSWRTMSKFLSKNLCTCTTNR